MCFWRRIHRSGQRALHVFEHNKRTGLASFRSIGPCDLAQLAINPGFLYHLALGQNPRFGVRMVGVWGFRCLESFDGGEGFEIGDRVWKLGDLIERDLRDLEAE